MTQSCFHSNQTIGDLVIVTTQHSFPVRREEIEGGGRGEGKWRGGGGSMTGVGSLYKRYMKMGVHLQKRGGGT